MAELSKIDVAALRKCNTIVVRMDRKDGTSSVYAVKNATKSERDPFACDQHHLVPAEVILSHSYRMSVREVDCIAHLYFSPGGECLDVTDTAVAALRAGDILGFTFYMDAMTTGRMSDAGFSSDCLYLTISRGGKLVAKFLVNTWIGQNSPFCGRFVRGAKEREETAA
jgi:hypothetical protein